MIIVNPILRHFVYLKLIDMQIKIYDIECKMETFLRKLTIIMLKLMSN